MKRLIALLISLAIALTFLAAAGAQRRADWLKKARWGVMTHYLPDWIDPQRKWTTEDWNKLVEGFDVEGLAKQLEAVGAGYHLISIGQNSGFYLAPNATYDRLVGVQSSKEASKCSRRDLVTDLHAALSKRGIRRVFEGNVDGEQLHMLSYLGQTWGKGAPRFTGAQVIKWTRDVVGQGGAVTWDAPVQTNGLLPQPFIEQLNALKSALSQTPAPSSPSS